MLLKVGFKALGSAASTSRIVFDKTVPLTTWHLDIVSTHRIGSFKSISAVDNGSLSSNMSASLILTSLTCKYIEPLQSESLLKYNPIHDVQYGIKELHLQQHLQQLDGTELSSAVCAPAAL